MKKLPLAILLILLSLSLSAQLTLEQSYSHSGTLTEISDGEFKYFMMDVPLNQLRLYNEDHSIYKTINLTVPAGYYLYDVKFVTRHLFNNDENIEFLYIYQKYEYLNNMDVYSYGMRIINENGSMLLNLDDGGFAEIMEGTDGPKLLAYRYIFYESYYLVYTNVYDINSETKTVQNTLMPDLKLYPNPADQELKISCKELSGRGTVLVTDMHGRKTIQTKYNTSDGEITLPSSGLASGIYIVSLMGDDGFQATGKFEKK